MKSPRRFLAAFTLGAAVAAMAALAPASSALAQEKEKGPKNSPALAKPLSEANNALKAKNYSDAIAKLKAAEAARSDSACRASPRAS